MLGDPPQRMDEAHVQHVVGFVQHQIGAFLQRDIAALQIRSIRRPGVATSTSAPLDQACACLLTEAPPTTITTLTAVPLVKTSKVVLDLGGDQLARRRQDQRADVLRPGRVADVQQAVQQRQAEGRGLAGAGLRKTHQVACLHDMRNGLRLDRRGGLELGGLFQRIIQECLLPPANGRDVNLCLPASRHKFSAGNCRFRRRNRACTVTDCR
jgi:hypothetical protein